MRSPGVTAAASDERGQATFLGIAIAIGAVALGMILVSVGRVYIAQAELQQAADIAALALAQPAGDEPGAHARALARANGADSVSVIINSDGRRELVAHAAAPKLLGVVAGQRLAARAVVPTFQFGVGAGSAGAAADGSTYPAGTAHGGLYSGPLVAVDASTTCPAVAVQYRAMQRSAAVSGVRLWAVSGYRSYAQQAVLYAQLGPGIAAPPGTSLHHAATEFDLAVGPAGSTVHRWLTANAGSFNFIQRYSWEPWHWGNVTGCYP